MLIALLAVLGVDLIVIVVVAAGMLSGRRWSSSQPGAFRGAIRVVDGELPGFGPKWGRGYGRWVRDVLVWTEARCCFGTSWYSSTAWTRSARQPWAR